MCINVYIKQKRFLYSRIEKMNVAEKNGMWVWDIFKFNKWNKARNISELQRINTKIFTCILSCTVLDIQYWIPYLLNMKKQVEDKIHIMSKELF